MTNQSASTTSPIDPAFTFLASLLVTFNVTCFFYLSAGTFTLFSAGSEIASDASDASVGYFGLLLSLTGLGVIGLLTRRYQAKYNSILTETAFPWPRVSLIERADRDKLLAYGSLLVILGTSIANIIASGKAYLENSHVACWDAYDPLARGFVGSRYEAVTEGCAGELFRMAPKTNQGPQADEWIPYLTDPGLIIALMLCIVFWQRWLVHVIRFSHASNLKN